MRRVLASMFFLFVILLVPCSCDENVLQPVTDTTEGQTKPETDSLEHMIIVQTYSEDGLTVTDAAEILDEDYPCFFTYYRFFKTNTDTIVKIQKWNHGVGSCTQYTYKTFANHIGHQCANNEYSMTEYVYYNNGILKQQNCFKHQDNEEFLYSTTHFDFLGNNDYDVYYDIFGNEISRCEYTYGNGKRTTKHEYSNGMIESFYEYDSAGNITLWISYSHGYEKKRTEFTYANGKKISEKVYSDGNLDSYLEYDSYGNNILKIKYVEGYERNRYEYDSHGNTTLEVTYGNGIETSRKEYIYTYEAGAKKSKVFYLDGRLQGYTGYSIPESRELVDLHYDSPTDPKHISSFTIYYLTGTNRIHYQYSHNSGNPHLITYPSNNSNAYTEEDCTETQIHNLLIQNGFGDALDILQV